MLKSTIAVLALLSPCALAHELEAASAETSSAAASSVTTQAEPVTEEAIREAIREYVIARYAGDPGTMQARTHHDIARRTVENTYWGQPSPEWVRPLPYDLMQIFGTDRNPARLDAPESGRCEITVFDIAERSAACAVVMEDAIDYLHMIHFEGRWVIADSTVLRLDAPGAEPPAASVEEHDTIAQIVRDYCVGFYELDGKKVQDTCHPSLSKRVVEQWTDGQEFDYLRSITWEEIAILGVNFNKEWGFDPETARAEVDVYEIRENMAIAKLTATVWFDYFQLLRVEGEWKIVNIIFEGLPRDRWSDVREG